MYKKNGPAIALTFHCLKEQILNIDLMLGQEKGLSWQAPGAGSRLTQQIDTWLTAYCQGKNASINLPLHFNHIPFFTKSVLEYLSTIPFGQTLSYQQLAQLVGNPKGARAVGQACGRNPFPLIIPCHRILTSQNHLGGFSCGLPVKQRLLAHEGVKTV